jgi:hypothetical protein
MPQARLQSFVQIWLELVQFPRLRFARPIRRNPSADQVLPHCFPVVPDASLTNIRRAVEDLDLVWIYDNTDIARVTARPGSRNGEVHFLVDSPPDWREQRRLRI